MPRVTESPDLSHLPAWQRHFALELWRLRMSKRMTGAELGKVLGRSGVDISRWERGERCPPMHIIIQLADFFEVSRAELAGLHLAEPLKIEE